MLCSLLVRRGYITVRVVHVAEMLQSSVNKWSVHYWNALTWHDFLENAVRRATVSPLDSSQLILHFDFSFLFFTLSLSFCHAFFRSIKYTVYKWYFILLWRTTYEMWTYRFMHKFHAPLLKASMHARTHTSSPSLLYTLKFVFDD